MNLLKERKKKRGKGERTERRENGAGGGENIDPGLSFTYLTNEEIQLSIVLPDHEQIAGTERIWRVFYLCQLC